MLATAFILALTLFSPRFAHAEPDVNPADEPAAAEGYPVVVLGRLVCMPCLMNDQDNAADLCELYNHGHQILVDVAQNGQDVDLQDMTGDVLDYYQPYTSSGPIMLGEPFHGRRILVHGAMVEGRLRVDRVRTVREPTPEDRAAANAEG